MPRRIESDWKDFRDVVSGRIRKSLKKFIKSGKIFPSRGKNGKLGITIPRLDTPRIVHGNNPKGVGRGGGKPGDVLKKDPADGGKGQAGQDEGEGIHINLDLEEVLKFMQNELALPNLKPKPNETFEEVKIKYNNISLIGPKSLRHNRRTFLQAIKRQAADGSLNELHTIPGFKEKIPLIVPISRDERFRQFKEIKIPSSNALIIYARDGSGSMDAAKCEIVSDMAWWIDVWIRRFYKKVDRMFVWHDTAAKEVDEDTFYNYRYGGGTTCSTALKYIAQQFDNRYPPQKWNIYVFYFTDGENWSEDNETFIQAIKNDLPPEAVNFIGITQILANRYTDSIKYNVDKAIRNDILDVDHVRTVSIGPDYVNPDDWVTPNLSDEERNIQILKAIKFLMGATNSPDDDDE